MNGFEKAAIFLWAVGEEIASEICKNLDKQDIGKISMSMTRLKKINESDIQFVLEEASQQLSKGDIYIRGESYLKDILTKGLGHEDADSILKRGLEDNAFDTLRWVDSHTLSNFLVTEHPQTIALILSLIEPSQAADVMASLPESLQKDVAIRIAKTERISSEAVEDIEMVIKEQLDMNQSERTKVEGIRTVAEILNHVNRSVEDTILDQINSHDSNLADSIKEHMFTFEDIASIDDKGIQILLRQVNTKDLSLALKTATNRLKEKIFRNLSQRAAEFLKDEMEVKGPVKLSDVERTQQKLVKITRELEEEGKLTINREAEEEVFV